MNTDLLRLLGVAFRRYSRDPSTRCHSARQMLTASIALMAEETSPQEASMACCETIASLAQAERVERRLAR